MAAVISASNNGTMLVRVTAGSELGGTDSNVSLGTLADGQTLLYNNTAGYWTNATLTPGDNIAITNGPGTVTIAATSAFGASTVSGANLATFSGTVPTGSLASTNTWTKIDISGTNYWVPIWPA